MYKDGELFQRCGAEPELGRPTLARYWYVQTGNVIPPEMVTCLQITVHIQQL